MFVNYAHRGASAYAPENTMSAFKKALELGANGIELDLQKTKDGKIVVFHDDYINEKSNGNGSVVDYTYQELIALDFGSWFNKEFKGERIVLFEDFAKEFLNKDLTFAIELKTRGIAKDTLEIIKKYAAHDKIYITSFIYEILENVRQIDKSIKIGWLIKEEINKTNINRILKIKGNQICPKASFVTDKGILLAKQNGIGVRLWGVNNEEVMEKVYDLDIDGMTVNFPDKLRKLLNLKEIIKSINFLNDVLCIKEDLRGCSSAIKYILKKDNSKYYMKLYCNDILNEISYIDSVYKKLQIPTANIIEKGYLSEFGRTYVIYEYINGKTLFDLTQLLDINEIEEIGKRTGRYLARFKSIKCNKEDVKRTYEVEFDKLIKNLYYMKNKFEMEKNKKLAPIDLDRLCKNFLKYKEYVYSIEPTFIHGDINIKNIIVNENDIYFIDNSGGKFSFRSLDFRGNCWYGWDGDNIKKEQAMYRGIYKGLFNDNIPPGFYIELAFTVMYEFLLKVYEPNKKGSMEGLEENFNKFYDMFNKTNYFEDYKFEWFYQ